MIEREANIEEFLSGRRLVGDDYLPDEIAQWFEDEREAYAGLGAGDRATYRYDYHALNEYHGFRRLEPGRRFENACGFGSAYGDEFIPHQDRVAKLTVVDSSRQFSSSPKVGIPVEFLEADPSGTVNCDNEFFDLILCLGVLHHIPNVSYVVGELARCLSPGGRVLIREPTTSMGDWRKPRAGVTARERGIPPAIMSDIVSRAGLSVLYRSPCLFGPLAAAMSRFGVSVGASRGLVALDAVLCRLSNWNYRYHRTSFLQKFAPVSEYMVLGKP